MLVQIPLRNSGDLKIQFPKRAMKNVPKENSFGGVEQGMGGKDFLEWRHGAP